MSGEYGDEGVEQMDEGTGVGLGSIPPPPPPYVKNKDKKQRKGDESGKQLASSGGLPRGGPPGLMCTLGWNCRGAGQPATVRELDCLIKTYKPCIIFLCETRQSEEKMMNLRFRLGMEGCYHVKGDGKGGGLAIYWQEGIIIDLLSFSNRHIDVHVSGGRYTSRWRATFVSGEPKPTDHHSMWTKLREVKNRSSEPWLMMGDFNEAMWQEEHFSRTKRSDRLMSDIREALSDCDLHDIGFTGTPWTFDNKQKGDINVKIRLDRAVASPEWSLRFPNTRLRHIISSRSEHSPLLLTEDV
jgi:hypothetical protein